MRRAADLTVGLLLGLLLIQVVCAVAIAVRVGLGSPVIFRQRRTGHRGREFTIVKFRSMRVSAYPGQPDSARESRLGRLLRASSLDELPQIWNIIVGDMSFIGPRPTLPEQVVHYSDRQRGRLAVRPGITGWAQVNGRNALSWPDRIELDLWYVAHRSITLDLKIILLTLHRVLRPQGIVGQGGVNPGFPAREPGAATRPVAAVATPNSSADVSVTAGKSAT